MVTDDTMEDYLQSSVLYNLEDIEDYDTKVNDIFSLSNKHEETVNITFQSHTINHSRETDKNKMVA